MIPHLDPWNFRTGPIKRVFFWLMILVATIAYCAGVYGCFLALRQEPWFMTLAILSFSAAYGGIALLVYVLVRLLNNDIK